MPNNNFPTAHQTGSALADSANLAAHTGSPTCDVLLVGDEEAPLQLLAERIWATTQEKSVSSLCQQVLNLTFFFDGTGNNLEADRNTKELSNVASLYLAHLDDDPVTGTYRIYIPGIGTLFQAVDDPGNTTKGLAFGAEGEARIKWAFNQFNDKLDTAIARATNPRNSIISIRIAAFGFSRGATLARAFAREFQKMCQQSSAGWTLKKGNYSVHFYFLGLWDTVASVGLPMSSNTTSIGQSFGWVSNVSAMRARNNTTNGVTTLAFGEPGADPAPGPSDGHGAWARSLEIPSMVEKCIHMIAAHETRNSFPLDSCRRDIEYPNNTQEMVYPGAHSDVGGGYRPGEGARSIKPGQMLSVLPLRAMHRLAWQNGVPLYPLARIPFTYVAQAFSVDQESQSEFERLVDLWRHYMMRAGFGGLDLGRQINSHMHLYYAWRFYKIRQNRAARTNRVDTKDEAELKRLEAQWREERRALEKQMAPLKKKFDAAHTELTREQNRRNAAEMQRKEYGTAVDPALQRSVDDAQARADAASDEYLPLKARYDTLPSCDGLLAHNLQAYDDQLMADADAIRMALLITPSLRVRPHYRNLLDAYEAEFIRGEGLRDEKIIEFFDTYVHDSLAGFARDATLPSDPRVVYVGGDVKSRHAQGSSSQSSAEVA